MNETLPSTTRVNRAAMAAAVPSAAAREAKAFEAYLTPLLGAAYSTALSMTRDREDAEDLVQEAAVQAFRCFDTLQVGTSFKAWFFRILTNLFLNRYRQQRRRPEVIPLAETADLDFFAVTRREGLYSWNMDPAALVHRKLDAEEVMAAIAALPAAYRTVSTLYFVEDFSYQEIAATLDCSIGTVRSRLHRGRKLLQRALWHLAPEQDSAAYLAA